jgi:hypothetical protein
MGRELAIALPRGVAHFRLWVWRWVRRPWALAQAHHLNPWVFVVMACIGHAIQPLVFLPWFQSNTWQLTFLILLRVVALVVPSYILLKGRGIAVAFNVSIAAMFVINTAWHVGYCLYA